MRWIPLLALLTSSTATAQDAAQTPEGAQRFVSILAEKGSLKVFYHYLLWPRFNLIYRVTSAASAGQCVTRLEGVPSSMQLKGRPFFTAPSPAFENDFKAFLKSYTHTPLPIAIDWSQVTSISITGHTVGSANDGSTLWIVGSAGGTALYVGDAALTKRVHYALTFLKEHCDKTGETGF